MTRRTQLIGLLGLGSVLVLGSMAQAQMNQRPMGGGPPVPVGAPSQPGRPAQPGAPATPADDGVITNAGDLVVNQLTGSDPGFTPPDDAPGPGAGRTGRNARGGTLPNTGGAPWMMVLAGSAMAASGLVLRRKLG